jgi:hypothetical protein
MTAGWYETGRRDKNLQAAVGPFCPKVGNKIRELTLGVKSLRPARDAQLDISWQTFTCECTARPGSDVFIFNQNRDLWWPAGERLEHTTENWYEAKTYLGTPGPETIHVIKANDIGTLWAHNYRRITDELKKYPPIIKGDLPRAFVSLANLTVRVVETPRGPRRLSSGDTLVELAYAPRAVGSCPTTRHESYLPPSDRRSTKPWQRSSLPGRRKDGRGSGMGRGTGQSAESARPPDLRRAGPTPDALRLHHAAPGTLVAYLPGS